MIYLLAAVITAAIGVLPLFFAPKKAGIAVGLGIFATLLLWWVYYATMPSFVYPLFGFAGVCTGGLLLLSGIIALIPNREADADGLAWGPFPGIGVLVLLLISGILGSSMFNASGYANMIGPVEKKDWTTAIQPKDPKHMLMVSKETANYLAKKAVGSMGAIGSQFGLETDYTTLQKINGRLMYAIPFDFNGFFPWLNSPGTPGFVLVDAQDPEIPVKVVQTAAKMHYTPKAWYGQKLERYLRQNGYLFEALDDALFEVDESGNPWWVVPVEEPTIMWSGMKVTGVVIINPFTGEIQHYGLDKVPAWVDRVFPGKLVQQYLSWRGSLSGGWLNSIFTAQGLTEPEDALLIYGANERAEWVMGISSASSKDDSLISAVFVDSRNGHAVEYNVSGGGTETAITNAVNNNKQVSFMKLTATSPQIYNIYNHMAAIVPVVNANDSFMGVAIVSLKDVTDVAFGATETEALRKFQTLLYSTDEQTPVVGQSSVLQLTGVIARIHQDVEQNDSPYYFTLTGVHRIFAASTENHPKLPLTMVGDNVTIQYEASGEDVVPVKSFDNLSLPLDQTKAQGEVRATVAAKQNAAIQDAGADDAQKRFNALPAAEKLRLMQQGAKKQ